MDDSVPTILWRRQQHSVGMTTQGFVGSLDVMAANETKTARYAEFAHRLKSGMAKSGVTAAAIVEELKVDGETVRLWRKGERMPGDAKLKRLAKMIGVSASDLRYGPEKSGVVLSQMQGEHVTDEDELALLSAYRGIKKEWAREALRRRAVELLEEFGEPGWKNPWKNLHGSS
jgi:transcriptional regulator with XRE-family HTH domain